MPDNSYFDRRMANGDNLTDIFDGLDHRYGVYTEDEERPITVRIGDKYNYVANNFILFDNWFAGILKSDSVKNLPTEVGDYFNFNPDKFNLFQIDTLGKIKAI